MMTSHRFPYSVIIDKNTSKEAQLSVKFYVSEGFCINHTNRVLFSVSSLIVHTVYVVLYIKKRGIKLKKKKVIFSYIENK